MARIVVGVDDSEGARRALAWAAQEAKLRQATLEVVHAYEQPPLHIVTSSVMPGSESLLSMDVWSVGEGAAHQEALRHSQEQRASVRRATEQAVERLIDEVGIEVPVERHVVAQQRPASVLIERSRDADLLVVGSSGRDHFAGLLLGSVSERCVHHAACPVVVIRPPA